MRTNGQVIRGGRSETIVNGPAFQGERSRNDAGAPFTCESSLFWVFDEVQDGDIHDPPIKFCRSSKKVRSEKRHDLFYAAQYDGRPSVLLPGTHLAPPTNRIRADSLRTAIEEASS